MGKFIHYYTTDDGWEFVSRKVNPYLNGNKKDDAVVIVPIRKFGDKTYLVITKEWRNPIGEYVYGFPSGLIDEGEDAGQAAIRELKEETGLDVNDILHVTPSLWSSEGLTDEKVVVVYVLVTGNISYNNQSTNEEIEAYEIDSEFASILLNNFKSSGKIAYFVLNDFANNNFNWLGV